MSTLKLYYHPLSSYCWKVLIALYENDTAFDPVMTDDAESWGRLAAVWPAKRFPVLDDSGRIVPETSIIIEYLAVHHPGEFLPIPAETEAALEVRLMDRLFDNYVMTPIQTIVADRIRPEGANRDPFGVARARELLATSYGLLESRLAGRNWAAGDAFTLADCAAMPSLFYANKVAPFAEDYPILTAYLSRLQLRSSVTRVLREAEPYLHMFPEG